MTERASRAPWSAVLLGPYLMLLATARPPIALIGYVAAPADLLFALLALLFALDVASARVALRWQAAWLALAAYGAAMVVSLLVTPALALSLAKLATQAYLLAIPLVIALLVTDVPTLRAACRWWLTGSIALAGLALVGLAAFAVAPDGALYQSLAFYQGSLPPGPYPRLALSFHNGNMAASYAAASMMIALLAGRVGWIGRRVARLLAAAMVGIALLAVSPGLGAIALALGWWGWMTIKRRALARVILAAGVIADLAMLAATATTLVPRAGLSPLLTLPGGHPLWPSIRLTIWQAALDRIADAPWLGHGIGVDPVQVSWITPSGDPQTLTDAHNLYLSVAAQIGVVGLAALLAILALAAAQLRRPPLPREPLATAAIALGGAFLAGMAVDGLTGSFEDSRHLWALFGLILGAVSAQPRSCGIHEKS